MKIESVPLNKPLSLLRRQLSSLCRLRDISLRPEGVFPSRGALGKEILFFVDCQSLSYKERWHPEGMTERLDNMKRLGKKKRPIAKLRGAKIMLHALLKGFLCLAPLLGELDAPKRGLRG